MSPSCGHIMKRPQSSLECWAKALLHIRGMARSTNGLWVSSKKERRKIVFILRVKNTVGTKGLFRLHLTTTVGGEEREKSYCAGHRCCRISTSDLRRSVSLFCLLPLFIFQSKLKAFIISGIKLLHAGNPCGGQIKFMHYQLTIVFKKEVVVRGIFFFVLLPFTLELQ